MTTLLETNTKRAGPYSDGLGKTEANYASLSPLSFLPKAAAIYPNRIAIIHGDLRSTWAETYARCRRLASALAKRGVGAGDTVAVMAPNVPAIYEAHFGVPMIGAVLNTLNIRLDAEAIAFQLTHGEAKVLITDREFSGAITTCAAHDGTPAIGNRHRRPSARQAARCSEKWTTKRSCEEGDPDFAWSLPEDEFRSNRPELHLGHHRQPEGCGHAPPRSLPERDVANRILGHAGALGLSLDPADVPLQRLVLSVDDGGQRRNQCLSSGGWTRS